MRRRSTGDSLYHLRGPRRAASTDYGATTATGSGFAIVPGDRRLQRPGRSPDYAPSSRRVDVCTTQVVFKPTSGGTKTGSLRPRPAHPAPLTVALKGIGVGTGTTTTAKKCKKKKRSAVAAKKCRKRK